MFRITIAAVGLDLDEAHILRNLTARLYPGEKLRRIADGYALEVSASRAGYLIDVLRIATEDAAFDAFGEWEQRDPNQAELELGADAARMAFG